MKSLDEELPPAIVIPASSTSSPSPNLLSNSPSSHKHQRKLHQQHMQSQQQLMSHQFLASPHINQSEKDVFSISPNSGVSIQQQQQHALAALVSGTGNKQTKDLIQQARSYAQQQAQIQQQNLQISQKQRAPTSQMSPPSQGNNSQYRQMNSQQNPFLNMESIAGRIILVETDCLIFSHAQRSSLFYQ